MSTKRIPQEELDAACRRLCRHIAAVIVQAMSDSDIGFAQMAVKLGTTEKVIRGWVEDLMDGIEGKTTIRNIAEICWALDVVPTFSTTPILVDREAKAQREAA